MTMLWNLLSLLAKVVKGNLPLACAMAGFFLGGYAAHVHYAAKIAEIDKQAYVRQAELQKERNEALTQVVNKQLELDRWRSTNDKRIADLTHRVQLADARRKRAEQAAGAAPDTSEGQCRALLVRGAAVVRGCSEVLGDAVTRHDALAELSK